MSTLEELKNMWQQSAAAGAESQAYTHSSLNKVIRTRIATHTKASMRYFWASFTLQMIVYGLLAHVIIKYGENSAILYFAIAGVLLYIPFTIVLMRKFKKLATQKPLQQDIDNSIHHYVLGQQTLLRSFYRFKRWYEFFLIPVSCSIGVYLVFELYVPGGVSQHILGAGITLFLSLASCAAAIYSENRKSFVVPIKQLQSVLDEFEQRGSSSS